MNAEGDSEDLITRVTALAIGANRGMTDQLGESSDNLEPSQQTVTIEDLIIKRDPGEVNLQQFQKVWKVKQLLKEGANLSKAELLDRLFTSLKK